MGDLSWRKQGGTICWQCVATKKKSKIVCDSPTIFMFQKLCQKYAIKCPPGQNDVHFYYTGRPFQRGRRSIDFCTNFQFNLSRNAENALCAIYFRPLSFCRRWLATFCVHGKIDLTEIGCRCRSLHVRHVTLKVPFRKTRQHVDKGMQRHWEAFLLAKANKTKNVDTAPQSLG